MIFAFHLLELFKTKNMNVFFTISPLFTHIDTQAYCGFGAGRPVVWAIATLADQ